MRNKLTVVLYLANYNFCRKHGTIKATPAVEA